MTVAAYHANSAEMGFDASEDDVYASAAYEQQTARQQRAGSTDTILTSRSGYEGTLRQRMGSRLRKAFSRKTLLKRLPVLSWLPRYSTEDAVGDLVAGITVGLTVIPQSLAYSSVAGLPPQYGLYGSFMGCFLYVLLGSCKDVPMGPTAIISLLTFQSVRGMGPEHAILLGFLTGVVQVVMGILGLGFLIDFISGPVSSGFTSAAALIIVTSQVKDVLGISAQGNTFVEMWQSLFQNMWNTKMYDAIMGFVCIVVLLLMRLLANIKVGPKEDEHKETIHKVVNKFLWLIATSRNAILVIVCGIIGYQLSLLDEVPVNLIGYIPAGLPAFELPPFSVTIESGNSTVSYSFLDMCSNLGSGIFVLPLVALLENIAVCKAFSNGKPTDATQELLAIGVCNIGNSFVQGFPGSGSLSRSAVNNSSGVRTTLGGLYTGLLVILSLLFFTQYFYFIPKASLAAIIIAAVIFMVELHVVVPIWKTSKQDLIPGFATFIACLVLQLELGIVVGIGVNILFVLFNIARPKIRIETNTTLEGVEYLEITPDRCLIFPSVDYVRNLVMKHSMRNDMPVVINCTHVFKADYTAAKVVECLTHDFSVRRQPLFFFNLKPSIVNMFSGLRPKDFIVYDQEDELDSLIRAHEKYAAAYQNAVDLSIICSG
ncbi:sodium-independent sulfate anion transporter-like [Schistocerca gregaria]|uniref:sodium-independent sulfate anion transporter-like n=1 Tax=Schistocerca gregaria TaxID=7010 RepID=UPI00211E5D51|nr:sodium-independent sulfate anion transporter-like [Schistocerca gregaria]